MFSMLQQLEACANAQNTGKPRRKGLKGTPNSVFERKILVRFEAWTTKQPITTAEAREILGWSTNRAVLGPLRRLEDMGLIVQKGTRESGHSTPYLLWVKL